MKSVTASQRETTRSTADDLYALGVEYEAKKKYAVASLNYIRALRAGSDEAKAIFEFDFENLDKMHVDPGRFEIIRIAANSSLQSAEFSLGARYYAGIDVEKDCAIGFFWMERAAKHGHATANFHVVEMYRRGEAVHRDVKKANLMMLKSAIAGCAIAQYRIGKQILSESVSDYEDEMAFQWIISAAKNGCKEAILDAGNMLMYGVRTKMSTVRGINHIQQSNNFGHMSLTGNDGDMNGKAKGATAF